MTEKLDIILSEKQFEALEQINETLENISSNINSTNNLTIVSNKQDINILGSNITSNNKIKLQRTLDESEIEEIVGTFDNKELSGVYRLIIDGEIEVEYKVIATKVY